MAYVAVQVRGIGKRFQIGAHPVGQRNYSTLRDTLGDVTTRFLQSARLKRRDSVAEGVRGETEFWALRDISFDVKQGSVVGLIGRNGSGKSTLLKVLSRITEPTEGYANVYGRIGSLLEVGTGFHPELTGRENVFLNGAVLGMHRPEIERKFDEIVAFSEVEKFIDTPVKHYSSGMYLRLAFAVAAHLEPEILIVDEVLAVGDAAFQKKCLGKMGEVAKGGRTVLFVSHNMAAVENLCQEGIVLNQGQMEFMGSQTDAIAHYLKHYDQRTSTLAERTDRIGTGDIRITDIQFRDADGAPVELLRSGQAFEIWLKYEMNRPVSHSNLKVSVTFRTSLDILVFTHHNLLNQHIFPDLPKSGAFVLRIPRLPLPAHDYKVGFSLSIYNLKYIDQIENAVDVSVIAGDYYGTGATIPARQGLVLIDGEWRLEG